MIRDYPFNLAPGAEVRPPIVGDYVALKSSSKDLALVQIQAEGDNGQVVANIEVLQGQGIPIPRGYGRLVIRNLDPVDTIDIVIVAGVGAFESFRLSGSVSFAGNLPGIDTPVNVSELAGSRLESVGQIEPIKLSDLSYWCAIQRYISIETILSPAANINGAVVEYASMAYCTGAIVARETIPSGEADETGFVIIEKSARTDSGAFSREQRIEIPAGFGLYAQFNAALHAHSVLQWRLL